MRIVWKGTLGLLRWIFMSHIFTSGRYVSAVRHDRSISYRSNAELAGVRYTPLSFDKSKIAGEGKLDLCLPSEEYSLRKPRDAVGVGDESI
jgi:hypothetical protein